jgi:hypothetical protein
MGRHSLVGIVIAGAVGVGAWIGAVQDASACSCGGESTLVAPIGNAHPVGAAVFFAEDCGGNLEAWTVTVDGAPAMLANSGAWSAIKGVAIEPMPTMGAEVVLSVACNATFGEPGCTDDPDATVEKARFTIGGPDTTAPPAVDGITLEQEDGEFFLGCSETGFDLRIGAVIDVGALEPGTWFEVSFTKNGEEIARNSHAIAPGGVLESSHHVMRSELAGAQTCVGVTVRDAAGNATELEQDCAEIGGEGCGCTAEDPRRSAGFGVLMLLAASRLRPSRVRRLRRRRA